jgi:hypothetical protein
MPVRDGFVGTVGATPLIRIASLSDATGCTILGKAEHLNPGGSVKDPRRAPDRRCRRGRGPARRRRPARDRRGHGRQHRHRPGAGGAGPRLPLPHRDARQPEPGEDRAVARARRGAAPGARLPFANPGNYYHVARRLAEERGAFWADQFENPANADAHYRTTGPELLADAPATRRLRRQRRHRRHDRRGVALPGRGAARGAGVAHRLRGQLALQPRHPRHARRDRLERPRGHRHPPHHRQLRAGEARRRVRGHRSRGDRDGALAAREDGLFVGGSAALAASARSSWRGGSARARRSPRCCATARVGTRRGCSRAGVARGRA